MRFHSLARSGIICFSHFSNRWCNTEIIEKRWMSSKRYDLPEWKVFYWLVPVGEDAPGLFFRFSANTRRSCLLTRYPLPICEASSSPLPIHLRTVFTFTLNSFATSSVVSHSSCDIPAVLLQLHSFLHYPTSVLKRQSSGLKRLEC